MKNKSKLKQEFLDRMEILLGKDQMEKYLESLKTIPENSIRCNTLKISPEKLKKRLQDKGWNIKQPFKKHPEILTLQSKLSPGELGKSLEHSLGYYYIQEISSMLPVMVLNPKPQDAVLDVAAAPGSKTTQIAALMNNTGILIANEISPHRTKILSINAERCGVSNIIITNKEGSKLCEKFKKNNFAFDKILLDASCSGEGTFRTNPKSMEEWNLNDIKRYSGIQKKLLASALSVLRKGGELVYSTCTHAPEENEEVIDFILKKFENSIKVEEINLPKEITQKKGQLKWKGKQYEKDVEKTCRIYPHKFDSEGFFIAKIRRVK